MFPPFQPAIANFIALAESARLKVMFSASGRANGGRLGGLVEIRGYSLKLFQPAKNHGIKRRPLV